jgi:hypothetical protein
MKLLHTIFVFSVGLLLLACSSPKDSKENSWYIPDQNSSWQWQLSGEINRSYSVDIYDIDLFDTTKEDIVQLQNKGIKVICYFSAGSYENWKEDNQSFPNEILGEPLDGWEGERWLDITNPSIKTIMQNRLDLAKEKGCDGVEPDNMDGYIQNSGFSISANDQIEYNKFIANEAHLRELSVGLKNDVDQLVALEPYFDFAVNEECHFYNECDKYTPFIENKKAILNAEYAQKYVTNENNDKTVICQEAKNLNIQTLILPLNLDDSFRYTCNE